MTGIASVFTICRHNVDEERECRRQSAGPRATWRESISSATRTSTTGIFRSLTTECSRSRLLCGRQGNGRPFEVRRAVRQRADGRDSPQARQSTPPFVFRRGRLLGSTSPGNPMNLSGCRRLATEMSSSIAFQWMPTPPPNGSHWLRCRGVAACRRGNHASGTETVRPSSSATVNESREHETLTARPSRLCIGSIRRTAPRDLGCREPRDHHIAAFNAVQHNVVACWENAHAGPEIVALPTGARMRCEEKKPGGQRIHQPIRHLDAAVTRDVEPEFVEIASASGARR